jgi:hypothetical protein
MTRQEQYQEAHDRQEVLRAQRAELEADLTHVLARTGRRFVSPRLLHPRDSLCENRAGWAPVRVRYASSTVSGLGVPPLYRVRSSLEQRHALCDTPLCCAPMTPPQR